MYKGEGNINNINLKKTVSMVVSIVLSLFLFGELAQVLNSVDCGNEVFENPTKETKEAMLTEPNNQIEVQLAVGKDVIVGYVCSTKRVVGFTKEYTGKLTFN